MTVDKRKGGMPMSTRMYRKVRLLAVGALAISALAASPALAGGGTKTTTAYKCAVAPNPVTLASTYTVSGSGFPPGMVVNVYIRDKISTWIINGSLYAGGTVAADGTFRLWPIVSTVYYPSNLGTKNVSVVNAYDRRTTTLATCTFSVQ
jgi:hypothetical protein